MNTPTFDLIVKTRLDRCAATLTAKAKEYAKDDDRFHNFRLAAAALGSTPERALLGFWMKHIVSIIDMIQGLDDPIGDPALWPWDEKIGDALNYLLILDAMRTSAKQRPMDLKPGPIHWGNKEAA